MKRKYFSALLMGALTVAATSTVTSCKDYDDDIQNLQGQIDDLSTFKTVKTELETKIADLKTQLEAADGQLTEAINKKADATELEKLAARVTSLEAQIKTAQEANENLTKLIAGKVDQSVYDEEVEKLYAAIASVNTDLSDKLSSGIKSLKDGLDNETLARESAIKDLQQEIDALKKLGERLSALENNTATETKIKELTESLEKLQDNVGDTSISDLKKDLKAASDKIDEFQKEINVLNVLIQQRLRSLVFVPDSYYWGIEAQSFNYLEAKSWTLAETAYDNVERGAVYGTGDKDDEVADDALATAGKREDHGKGLYPSENYTSVMDLWANYHLNPSDVKASDFKYVSVLDADKNYINTRASEAVLTVKKDADGKGIYKVEDGILKVQLDVKNPDKIKKVLVGENEKPMVTVFAAQVHLNNKTAESEDTVITSDYATLYADKYTNIRLSHTTTGATWDEENYTKVENGKTVTVENTKIPAHNSFDGQLNTHCGACSIDGHDGLHLMSTVHEATTLKAQDECNWNQTMDLRKLVEIHWDDLNGKHVTVSPENAEQYGLKFKFELTGYYAGNNRTSESAHAAIASDGYTFNPQMPEKETGKQQAYDLAKRDLQTVGRTPLVRVSLLDKYGKVLDYGYIRILITRSDVNPTYNYKEVDYTSKGANQAFNDACDVDFKGYQVYKTQWVQTEYDIYNMLGMAREDFENYYGETPELYSDGSAVQYQKDANGKYQKLSEDEAFGIVTNHPDLTDGSHEETSVLEWNVEAYKAGGKNVMLKRLYDQWKSETNCKTAKSYPVEIAIKYTRQEGDESIAPDVYVKFKTTVTFNPMTQWAATINWGNNKISEYWYNTNTEVTADAKNEIHVNTITPEDAAVGATATPLDNYLSDNFLNNRVVKPEMVSSTQDGFNASNFKYSLEFDESNVGKEFLGNDGKTYVLSVSDEGKTLNANIKGDLTTWAVAKLVVSEDHIGNQNEADYTTVDYQNTEYAKALLNYASRNDYKNANNDVLNKTLTAVIGVVAKNDCQTVTLSNNTFNVRFIRPINVTNNNKEIEDANVSALQTIKLSELVNFTDWRNTWKDNYKTYYGVKSIRIAGVGNGEVISQNTDVKANINNEGFKSLASQTSQLDFKCSFDKKDYDATLTYKNLSSTVGTFEVQIPLTVSYLWGDIYTTATITVNKTAGAKKH